VRDDAVGEIRGARHLPPLLQCSARYREPPAGGRLPHVDITLPDGTHVGSDAPDVNARLSALLGRSVSLWPLQPASHKAHYRRAYAGARLMGQLSRCRLFRRVLRRLLPYTSWEASARALLGREPDEPLPDFSRFPYRRAPTSTPTPSISSPPHRSAPWRASAQPRPGTCGVSARTW
jgi:hypothetical protein